jgi:membrane associated rhomboid family serine protease
VIPLRDNVPTRTFPVITVALIVANVLVYFIVEHGGFQAAAGPVNDWGYQPCEVEGSCPVVGVSWTIGLFSSLFLHADLIHLGGNMLFLWIFGNNVEDALGPVRYLVFYLLSGVAATALQTAVTLQTASDAAAAIPNLGASGAISGVLGAYIVLLPRARVLTLIFFVFFREIPAVVFLGLWFVFQAWQANMDLAAPPESGGVAVFAHVGGFVFGVLAVKAFQRRAPLRPSY